jgi:3-hydroxyacyl-[acyl-carrier-protein] dehydratase
MSALRNEIVASTDGQARTLEGGGGYELTFRLGRDFIGFSGHFPGNPILPAFVQLLMGQCALQIRSGRNWRLRKVERAKFMKTIAPGQAVKVCWREQPLEDGLRGSFSLLVGDQKMATFTTEFEIEEGGNA